MTKNTETLLRLVQENPDLPVVPMVDGGIAWDDSGYFVGRVRVRLRWTSTSFPGRMTAFTSRVMMTCSTSWSTCFRTRSSTPCPKLKQSAGPTSRHCLG